MRTSFPTRRTFCTTAAAAVFAPRPLMAEALSSRPDVAAIDRERILKAADNALGAPPAPLTTLPAPNSPGPARMFYSESNTTTSFSAHRDALLALSRRISALAAAFYLTAKQPYAAQANLHLQAWFIDPITSMVPDLTHAAATSGDPKPRLEGVVEGLPLAELAQSLPFLANGLTPQDLAALKAWFKAYLDWLATSRVAGLARDQKDHHGISWLLQATAYARFVGDTATLADLRHRFKTTTLRAQLVADGTFPHELTTPFPYRNSLFALDLLAGSCHLLSTQFESLWEYELQDGPGLRAAIARHYPYIQKRGAWPYQADRTHFTDLPVRSQALLFAARAYLRPEYAELWKVLPPEPNSPELQYAFPISQPLLWIARTPARS